MAAGGLWPRKDTPPTASEPKAEGVAERLKEPGDSVTLIATSGLPLEQVGPLDEFVGSVSANVDGR